MDAAPESDDFVMTVDDVFNLTGRGVVVVGRIQSGVISTGDEVEIWDDGRVVMTAVARVELICRRPPIPDELGLRLGNIDKSKLRVGQTARRSSESQA